ncbi:MAG: AAA family ATPase [Chitinophagaceae bacterium]|nr:AAA family ATPase [Chitinophagaceae bacterium]
MIIVSIEIENFLSYYKKNRLDFDLGPTVILGQNNTGKSKLFDAFNWVLYDRAFKTTEEVWAETKDWREDLINRKAKAECRNGEYVACSVCLTFLDEDENKYLLAREYSLPKSNEGNWQIPRNSDLSLTRTDAVTSNDTNFYDRDAEEQLLMLFPENLSRYFLFQGENISQIMSLSNKSAFTKALRDLSRIEVFEKAKAYADKVLKNLKRDFENKADADNALHERKIRLSQEIDKLKEDVAFQDEQFDNECRERNIQKEQFEKKNNELKMFEECAAILRESDYLEAQRLTKNELRASLITNQKRDVFDKWMYAGTDAILNRFLSFYKQNKIEKKIPEPIRQEFIKEMLAEHKCKVCGSDAADESDAYKKIASFLNDRSLDKEIELINQLSMVADNMLDKVTRIPEEIKEFYLSLQEVEDQIRSLQNKIKAKEEELRSIIPSGISEDEIKAKNFIQIQRDRDRFKNDLDGSESKINQIKGRRDFLKKELDNKLEEYESLIAQSSNTKEKERFQLAEKVNASTSQFYDHFLNRIISDIEENANKFFTQMTIKNAALSGKVKVDFANKEVYTIDEAGTRLFNINQANKVSLQIAFVAAVLDVSNRFWDNYFPFIADAPISALGGNNKLTAIDTMIEIFNQSIVILKDDALTYDPDNLRNDVVRTMIMGNSAIKNAYELVMEGDNEQEQHTLIKKIK